MSAVPLTPRLKITREIVERDEERGGRRERENRETEGTQGQRKGKQEEPRHLGEDLVWQEARLLSP